MAHQQVEQLEGRKTHIRAMFSSGHGMNSLQVVLVRKLDFENLPRKCGEGLDSGFGNAKCFADHVAKVFVDPIP